MTIKEAVEIYKARQTEIKAISNLVENVLERNRQFRDPMGRFVIDENEFLTIITLLRELKAIKESELNQEFQLDEKDNTGRNDG